MPMRVRTDERRRAIVDAAWAVFKENGYDRTTMSDISERVGGSKATLYGYFQSKDQLFAAALEDVVSSVAEETFARFAVEGDLESRLLDYSRAYLEARLTTDALAVERALIADGAHSDRGERLRMRFILPHWRRMAAAVDEEMEAGRLRRADPLLATWHLRGLIEADIVERALHGDRSITAHEVEAAATGGVDVFLRAYAP